jgi:uncharacterized protein
MNNSGAIDFKSAHKFYHTARSYQLMAKPVGSHCNLNCTYCYYLEKKALFPSGLNIMPDNILESFIKQYIESQASEEVHFIWQGEEPALAGIPYYEKVVRLQRKYRGNKKIFNAFQSNGTLIHADWCRFFRDNQFLLGLSIDGPEHLHNYYRKNKANQGSFREVMKAVELAHFFAVDFNTLTTVNRINAEHPLEVYRFLKQIGSRFLQFLPVAERQALIPKPLKLVPPGYDGEAIVSGWSLKPLQYGRFLVQIYDEWKTRDIGHIFIQIIEATLANKLGLSPGVCVFDSTCGHALILEHTGDIYACDHYVFPEYKLGNLADENLVDLVQSPGQINFGLSKQSSLPPECKNCRVLYACHGECPKHRFELSSSGERNLNYLCQDYKLFFLHVESFIDDMAKQLINQ